MNRRNFISALSLLPAIGVTANASTASTLQNKESTSQNKEWVLQLQSSYGSSPVYLQGWIAHAETNQISDVFQTIDIEDTHRMTYAETITALENLSNSPNVENYVGVYVGNAQQSKVLMLASVD